MTESPTYIGITNWRDKRIKFGIRDQDLMRHMYIIGKTASGKSSLILNAAVSQIQSGKAFALIDPHGDLADELLKHIPKHRINDVIYINPAEYPMPFNLLKKVNSQHHHLVASGLISTFKKIWSDSWGPRTEHLLRFATLTLLEWGDGTILDIQKLLTDKSFRNFVLLSVRNADVKNFWANEYEKYADATRATIISPILNKMGVFASSKHLKDMFGSPSRCFTMQEIMDGNKILIVNLSKGRIGNDTASFIGSMLVSSIQLAALFRAGKQEHERKNFTLFVDEAHSFLTTEFCSILAEARKYKLGVVMSTQYLSQLQPEIWEAIKGNVGTMIVFRVGASDAQYLAKEFHPTFKATDMVNLPAYGYFIKLMIDGSTSRPFSADGLPPPLHDKDYSKEISTQSKRLGEALPF